MACTMLDFVTDLLEGPSWFLALLVAWAIVVVCEPTRRALGPCSTKLTYTTLQMSSSSSQPFPYGCRLPSPVIFVLLRPNPSHPTFTHVEDHASYRGQSHPDHSCGRNGYRAIDSKKTALLARTEMYPLSRRCHCCCFRPRLRQIRP